MKRIKLILLVILLNVLILPAQVTEKTEFTDLFKMMNGDWKMLFLGYEGTKQEISGRGEMQGEMAFSNFGVKLSTTINGLAGLLEMNIYMVFNRQTQGYSLTVVNSDGSPATATEGKFDPSSKMFVFRGYPSNYEQSKIKYKITLRFEREDKFVITFYNVMTGEDGKESEVKTLEYGFVKK